MGTYIRLVDYGSQQEKENAFLGAVENKNISKIKFNPSSSDFPKIPGSPIAYWISAQVITDFQKGTLLSNIAQPKQGMVTRDNNRFIRLWWEVAHTNTEHKAYSHDESKISEKKWYPITAGGSFRKWYGNNESVVNFKNDGKEIIDFSGPHIKNREFYFRESISWSAISSAKLSMRYAPKGFLPEHAGNCLYAQSEKLSILQALCNSNVGLHMMSFLSPTLNFNVGDIASIPIMNCENRTEEIIQRVSTLRELSKDDWDSFETSWDFKKNPLI